MATSWGEGGNNRGKTTLADALAKRIAAADNDNQRNYLTQQAKRLNTAGELYALETKGIDASGIVQNSAAAVAICDKGDSRNVAQQPRGELQGLGGLPTRITRTPASLAISTRWCCAHRRPSASVPLVEQSNGPFEG